MEFSTIEMEAILPSFQSVFSAAAAVDNDASTNYDDGSSNTDGNAACAVRLSEPDSDFEFDVQSDCSSNVSSSALFGLQAPSTVTTASSCSASSPSSSSSYSGSISGDEGVLRLDLCRVKEASSSIEKSIACSSSSSSKRKYHPCQQCPKAFPNQSHLEEHVRYRHSDVRHHQCHLCPKVFKTVSNLNQHLRTHLMGKMFRCELCDRAFTESGLKYHLLTHQSEKSFSCPLCPKGFVQNKLLQKHISSCHSQERKHGCMHCPSRFKRKDHLNRHIANAHSLVENLFECGLCHVKLQSARILRQHEKLHRKKDLMMKEQFMQDETEATDIFSQSTARLNSWQYKKLLYRESASASFRSVGVCQKGSDTLQETSDIFSQFSFRDEELMDDSMAVSAIFDDILASQNTELF